MTKQLIECAALNHLVCATNSQCIVVGNITAIYFNTDRVTVNNTPGFSPDEIHDLTVKRTSLEWMDVFKHSYGSHCKYVQPMLTIGDPDGWDRTNMAESLSEKISVEEYINRVNRSSTLINEYFKWKEIFESIIPTKWSPTYAR